MDFGSGFTSNVFPVLPPPSSNIERLFKSLKKERVYEFSIDNRYTLRVGDLGHDIE
jgi:hypothetical protein